uniref:Uncharacterized protein n=1 Tax=Amphimedon queenslandica TaxID=400682 RepID=A0A1X7USK6_AMPQE
MFEDILNGSVWTTYTMKRTKGVSLRGYWMELFGKCKPVFKLPEVTCLRSQVRIPLLTQLNHTRLLPSSFFCNIIQRSVILFLLSTLLHFIPNTVFSILLLSRIPVMSLSKCLHIQALYSSKTSANVSALTWGISAYNCLVRVWTSLYNLNDYIVTASYLTNAVLNIDECIPRSYKGLSTSFLMIS